MRARHQRQSRAPRPCEGDWPERWRGRTWAWAWAPCWLLATTAPVSGASRPGCLAMPSLAARCLQWTCDRQTDRPPGRASCPRAAAPSWAPSPTAARWPRGSDPCTRLVLSDGAPEPGKSPAVRARGRVCAPLGRLALGHVQVEGVEVRGEWQRRPLLLVAGTWQTERLAAGKSADPSGPGCRFKSRHPHLGRSITPAPPPRPLCVMCLRLPVGTPTPTTVGKPHT